MKTLLSLLVVALAIVTANPPLSAQEDSAIPKPSAKTFYAETKTTEKTKESIDIYYIDGNLSYHKETEYSLKGGARTKQSEKIEIDNGKFRHEIESSAAGGRCTKIVSPRWTLAKGYETLSADEKKKFNDAFADCGYVITYAAMKDFMRCKKVGEEKISGLDCIILEMSGKRASLIKGTDIIVKGDSGSAKIEAVKIEKDVKIPADLLFHSGCQSMVSSEEETTLKMMEKFSGAKKLKKPDPPAPSDDVETAAKDDPRRIADQGGTLTFTYKGKRVEIKNVGAVLGDNSTEDEPAFTLGFNPDENGGGLSGSVDLKRIGDVRKLAGQTFALNDGDLSIGISNDVILHSKKAQLKIVSVKGDVIHATISGIFLDQEDNEIVISDGAFSASIQKM